MATSTPTPTLVSSVPELESFLSSIPPVCTLYLDLEGKNLSRHGTISLITVLINPERVVRLIDVLALGEATFTTASKHGKTLKSILEDPIISKFAWDVRNDADALWALYHVGLAGITDIQLLENATRTGDKTYVRGLDKCVQFDLKLGFMALHRWIQTKKEVQSLMATDVFANRPINAKILQYCVNDVVHLPDLHTVYLNRVKGNWLAKTLEESARRVAEAHSPGYEPQSPTKKLGPWGSGTGNRVVTTDEMFEILEQQREDNLARDIFGDDDSVGCFDDDYDWDDRINAADAAFDPEALESCWDKSG